MAMATSTATTKTTDSAGSFRVRSRRVQEQQPQQQQHRQQQQEEEDPDWVGQQDNAIVTNCDTEGCDMQAPHILVDPLTKIPMEYTCLSALIADDDEIMSTTGSPTTSTNATTTTTADDDETTSNESPQPLDYLSESFVRVDYEALLPRDDAIDVAHNERQLQWRVLLAAVEDLGLDTCDFQQQREPDTYTMTLNTRRRRRRNLKSRRQLEQPPPEEEEEEDALGLDPSLTIFAVQNDFFLSAAYQNRMYR
jgi:hypothetical protein